MAMLLSALAAMLAAAAYAAPSQHLLPRQNNITTAAAVVGQFPRTFAALGDSFSAGIGSGKFLQEDGNGGGDRCARQDGSYPSRLAALLGTGPDPIAFDNFESCSGDVLSNIGGQVSYLNGALFDLVTLSISGNDFGFADIVAKCVYPWSLRGQDAEAVCNEALDTADALIDEDRTWDLYRTNVDIILGGTLSDVGRLYITGYSRFFSPEGSSSDSCENFYFNPVLFLRDLTMKFAIRDRMNRLVLKVNSKIQSEVVEGLDPAKIKFVDIDPVYKGHRFCEPGKDQKGADDPDTYFNDINTKLAETRPWTSKTSLTDAWDAWLAEKPEGGDLTKTGGNRGLADELQRSSTFHPKARANYLVAVKLQWEVMFHAPDDPNVTIGPAQFCQGLSPGGGESCLDIPANCGLIQPGYNVEPTIACQDGSSPNGLF